MAVAALSPCVPSFLAFLLLSFAVTIGGCCCAEPEAGLRVLDRATAPTSRFIVVMLTCLDQRSDDGAGQVLIEAMVVSAPPGMDIQSRMRSSMDASAAMIRSEVHNARILHLPSVVTVEGEEAAVEVSDAYGDGGNLQSLIVKVPASTTAESMTIELTYEQRRGDTPVYSLPPTMIEVPKGKPVVIAVPRR